MKVFILAGGFATRLWPLTEKRAKPMLMIDGKPILQHILEQIPPALEIYLLTNSQFEASFKAYLDTQDRTVHIFCEDTHCDAEKLGALAAVATAIQHYNVNDDILVLAGDNLLPELDIKDLFPAANEARLAVQRVPDLESARAFGVVEFENKNPSGLSKVTSFIEKPAQPKSKYVSTGFMGIGADLLPTLMAYAKKSPDALGAVITEFLQTNGSVTGFEVQGDWFDVGSYEAYLAAHKTLQQEPCKIHPNAEVTNCQFKGKVYIAAGAKVKDSVLIDTVVYPYAQLIDCHISQSVIDEYCNFEGVDLSRKLLRQGTTISNKSK